TASCFSMRYRPLIIVPGGVGNTLLQRTQFRSVGGLATPQAGLLQMMTLPASPAVSSSLGWVQPHSMQQMALGSIPAPQAGHLLPPPPEVGMFGNWNSLDEAPALLPLAAPTG